MPAIISVEKISKLYQIGAVQTQGGSLRESLADLMRGRTKIFGRNGHLRREDLWALRDVSFTIEQGEIVGVLGSNGAGKSTLLKILSRITAPTSGRIELYGRVGSLLEVGTGFHPELTGRENIYLNGAILGMKQEEINRKLDEIIAFSEIERFIDTPVKYYSTGMYMRLAFAIAAHLEPEILIVDEVLAVGDAAFQKKCLGKMDEVTKEGRTIIFVSHNMIAVQSLCKRALWLRQGQLIADGAAKDVIAKYLVSQDDPIDAAEEMWDNFAEAPGNNLVRLHRVVVRPEEQDDNHPLTMKSSFRIDVELWNLVPDMHLHVTLHLKTAQGVVAFTTANLNDSPWLGRGMPAGLFRCSCHVPGNLLNTGLHRFKIFIVRDLSDVIFEYDSTVSFEIHDLEERELGHQFGREPGVVQPILKWTTEYLEPAAVQIAV